MNSFLQLNAVFNLQTSIFRLWTTVEGMLVKYASNVIEANINLVKEKEKVKDITYCVVPIMSDDKTEK